MKARCATIGHYCSACFACTRYRFALLFALEWRDRNSTVEYTCNIKPAACVVVKIKNLSDALGRRQGYLICLSKSVILAYFYV
jgi:hypothetical protein